MHTRRVEASVQSEARLFEHALEVRLTVRVGIRHDEVDVRAGGCEVVRAFEIRLADMVGARPALEKTARAVEEVSVDPVGFDVHKPVQQLERLRVIEVGPSDKAPARERGDALRIGLEPGVVACDEGFLCIRVHGHHRAVIRA